MLINREQGFSTSLKLHLLLKFTTSYINDIVILMLNIREIFSKLDRLTVF